MEIETELFCPLGMKCKEIKDNKIHRCMWLLDIDGQDQMGNESKREDCAISFMPIAILENARWSKGTQAAVESNRNEGAKLNNILTGAIQQQERLTNV